MYSDGKFQTDEITVRAGEPALLNIRNLSDQTFLVNIGEHVRDQEDPAQLVTRVISEVEEPGELEAVLTPPDGGDPAGTLRIVVAPAESATATT